MVFKHLNTKKHEIITNCKNDNKRKMIAMTVLASNLQYSNKKDNFVTKILKSQLFYQIFLYSC